MTIRVQVIGGKVQQDVLFPSREFTYGNLINVDDLILKRMKTIGIKFGEMDATGVYLGVIDGSMTKSIDLSRLLSSGRRSYPIYLMGETDELIGFWQGGFWFDDQNAEISRYDRYLERVTMTPVPICLA